MVNRATRAAARRPGAGVTIDRGRLVRLRQEALLSRSQLAAKMSTGEYTITPDAIAKIENGYRRPKTSTLARLCTALGCEPEQLLPGPDMPPSGPVPCAHCGGLFGHESGCQDAT